MALAVTARTREMGMSQCNRVLRSVFILRTQSLYAETKVSDGNDR